MTRFIVSILMVTGFLAAPAQAGAKGGAPHESQDVRRLELPAETLAAFEEIAQAGEARRGSADPAAADAQLADGLRRLAAGVTLLSSDVEFATFVAVEIAVVGPEVSARISRDLQDGDELALALDAVGAAKLDWLERRAASGEPEGPRSGCFMKLVSCMRYCAGMDSFVMRAACGLDCETDFLVCQPLRFGLTDLIRTVVGSHDTVFN